MITLASDFGSPYPAAMRGVIRRNCAAELLDVSHDLPRGDPRAAAFWLRFVLPEFPPAVHCAVVDPGVGTGREALVIRAGDHVLVAPDNGLALPPARGLVAGRSTGNWPRELAVSDDANSSAFDTADIDVFTVHVTDPASTTFHGRDVFAPTAASVHNALESAAGDEPGVVTGSDATDVLTAHPDLSRTTSFVNLRLPDPIVDDDDTVARGVVLVVDDFGNVITNVAGTFLERFGPDLTSVTVNGESVPVAATFGSVPQGDRLVTVGSHGYLVCDVNDGRGDAAFGLDPGDTVRFEIEPSGGGC